MQDCDQDVNVSKLGRNHLNRREDRLKPKSKKNFINKKYKKIVSFTNNSPWLKIALLEKILNLSSPEKPHQKAGNRLDPNPDYTDNHAKYGPCRIFKSERQKAEAAKKHKFCGSIKPSLVHTSKIFPIGKSPKVYPNLKSPQNKEKRLKTGQVVRIKEPKCGVFVSTLALKSPIECPWYKREFGIKSETSICSIFSSLASNGKVKGIGPIFKKFIKKSKKI